MWAMACRIENKASEQSEDWQHCGGGVPFITLDVTYIMKNSLNGYFEKVTRDEVRVVESFMILILFQHTQAKSYVFILCYAWKKPL